MKKIFILLIVHLVILLLCIELYQRNREYNIVARQNNFLNDSLHRILLSKKGLKENLNKKIKYINTVETELEAIHKFAQGLQADKKMLRVRLEEELTKRKTTEADLRLAANKVKNFEQQIAKLNQDIGLYKAELTSIYASSGEKDSYGLTLSRRIALAKEGQAPYGRVTVVSKEYNFIIVAPFNKEGDLGCGTAIEIYYEGKRIALGAIKAIQNDLVLVDDIVSYSQERYIKQGDLVLAERASTKD